MSLIRKIQEERKKAELEVQEKANEYKRLQKEKEQLEQESQAKLKEQQISKIQHENRKRSQNIRSTVDNANIRVESNSDQSVKKRVLYQELRRLNKISRFFCPFQVVRMTISLMF